MQLKCKEKPYFCPFWNKNPPKSVRNIEVSAITKHRSAVVVILSAKSRFSAKTPVRKTELLVYSILPDASESKFQET